MLKCKFTRYLMFTIFHARYTIYLSFINLSSKNNSEVEFYRKKIINQHFSSRKSQKAIRKVMRMFEIRDLYNNCKKQFFAYKTKDIDYMEKNSI